MWSSCSRIASRRVRLDYRPFTLLSRSHERQLLRLPPFSLNPNPNRNRDPSGTRHISYLLFLPFYSYSSTLSSKPTRALNTNTYVNSGDGLHAEQQCWSRGRAGGVRAAAEARAPPDTRRPRGARGARGGRAGAQAALLRGQHVRRARLAAGALRCAAPAANVQVARRARRRFRPHGARTLHTDTA